MKRDASDVVHRLPVGTPYKRHRDFEGYDAIVIGSGIGGLTVAALLTRFAGYRVLVLERHYTAGGFTHTFTRPGYEWDVGVHYIGGVLHPDQTLGRLFNVITGGRVKWASLGKVYDRVIMGDRVFDYVAGRENLRAALYRAFPEEREVIDEYLRTTAAAAKATERYFALKALPRQADLLSSPFLKGFYAYADRTTRDTLYALEASPKLAGVLTAQYGDYGLPPGKSSFVMHALLVEHYIDGAAYPVGGASSIPAGITRVIEEGGGAVLVRAEVERILLKDGKAVGVRLVNGHEIFAPRIISDAGFATTFTRLVPRDLAERIGALDVIQRVGISMAHICLHVGLKGSSQELGLPKFNYWVYPNEHHDANMEQYLADVNRPFPLLFISFASARDPDFEARYPGRSTLEVITAANWEWFRPWDGTRWRRRGDEYEAFKARLTERLLDALYTVVPQVKGRVEVAELSTPLSTVEFTGHPQGAIYGLAHTPARFREPLLRPHTPVRNLYLTGADVSTAGVAGALMGGVLTASVILKRNVLKQALKG